MTTTEPTTEPTTLTRTVDGRDVPPAGTYVLDTAHSEVGFTARHLMVSKVRGRFAELTGSVTIAEDPTGSSVEVSMAAASIESRDDQRDAHLRSPDFLDVEAHPTLTYRSTAVTPTGARTWAVDGELTIRGVTRPVGLEVTFEGAARDPWGGTAYGFSASGELDREEFGLTWNQALETGGVLVGKAIRLHIEAELTPAGETEAT
jgi:polyisoprenoid-binding protein YceI